MRVIDSEDEQQSIVDKFPEKLRPFLNQCSNPLDETQVLVNLFKEKGVRIIIGKYIDDFGNDEFISYYHTIDIANQIKYNEKNTNDWHRLWEIDFVGFENLPLKISGAFYKINFENKKTGIKANFISEHDLKKVLLKIKSQEANIFQDWILRQSTLCKKY